MVKKDIYVLEHSRENTQWCEEHDFLLQVNRDVHDMLSEYKGNIDEFFSTGEWERVKRRTNAYELVFTPLDVYPSVCNYMPTSRSFFKMWEMLHDFPASFGDGMSRSQRCAFLAEGPGGFVEAYAKWRGKLLKGDTLFATTLLNVTKKSVPVFKIPSWVSDNAGSLTLTYGPEGTGNVCSLRNLKGLVAQMGAGLCDIVTADGGFDFSADFNSQEKMSTVLIMCEVLMALQLQKLGGTFVCKVYDISMYRTFQILHVLQRNYTRVYIVKPHTSRPANSEKYLVCTGFMGQAHDDVMMLEAHLERYRAFRAGAMRLPIVVPLQLMYDMLEFNLYFVTRQIMYIAKTVQAIKKNDTSHLDDVAKEQVRKALKWCHKYRMPIIQLDAFRQLYGKPVIPADSLRILSDV